MAPLERAGARLPAHVQRARAWQRAWAAQRARMAAHMAALERLRAFYARFCAAYDALLLEVGRRRAVQRHMLAVVREARAKLDRLYQGEFPFYFSSFFFCFLFLLFAFCFLLFAFAMYVCVSVSVCVCV
jgi:uncharacterized membrane protein